MANLHEKLIDQDIPGGPSNRSFGLTISVALLLLVVVGKFRYDFSNLLNFTMLALAVYLATFSWLAPERLNSLNLAWGRLGDILHKLVTPIIMLFVYLVAFLPLGILIKLMKKDQMLRFKESRPSYWIAKENVSLDNPMKYQF